MYSKKFLKNSIKLFKEFISSNVPDLLYSKSIQRADGHSKGTRGSSKGHLGTRRAFEGHSRHSSTWDTWPLEGHLGTQGTWTFGHSNTWSTRTLEGHLGTRALKAFGHFDTRALEGHLGTQVLRHSGTRSTRYTLFSRLLFEFRKFVIPLTMLKYI